MAAILEIVLAVFVWIRTRAAAMSAWSKAHPFLASVWGSLGGSAIEQYIQARIGEIESTVSESASQAKDSVMDFLHVNEGLNFVRFTGNFWADKLNVALGLKGTSLEISTVDNAVFLTGLQNVIQHDIVKGGGLLLSGQTIQGLRTGSIATMGFAAKGVSATGVSTGGIASGSLSDKAARKRLLNRERQAKWRKTHKRRATWVAK